MVTIASGIRISMSEIELSYVRSSGPGGQNVNKVNSKAVLHWNLVSSLSLTESVRTRLIAQLGHRLNSAGEIVITSDRFRDQIRNREDCFEKLRVMLLAAARPPKPRKKTKVPRSSVLKTKRLKSQQSMKKKLRKSAGRGDSGSYNE